LKLTGFIEWSWVWVLSPLWIASLLVLGVLFFALCMAFNFSEMYRDRMPYWWDERDN
jgi:preprotein translocase subunit SecG